MELSNDELEDCMEQFKNIFLDHKNNKRDIDDLFLLTENLSEDLKISRQNEETMRCCLNRSLESDNAKITTKYVTLDEQYRKLEAENIKLKQQIEELTAQFPAELAAQKKEFDWKIKEIENSFNMEITNLTNQLGSDRICYETKENEFQSQLQALQAASALERDEIETNLQRQLVDTNSKLRQSQNTIRSLQLELSNVKSQLVQQKYNNTPARNNNVLYFQESPIQAIRNNLAQQRNTLEYQNGNEYERPSRPSSSHSTSSRMTELIREFQQNAQQNTNVSEKIANDTETAVGNQYVYPEKQQQTKATTQLTKTQNTRPSETTAKYHSLSVDYFPEDDEPTSNGAPKNVYHHRPIPHKGSRQTNAKNSNKKQYKQGLLVQPLMPCSTPKTKKRKLFDPDNLEYLQSLMDDTNDD